MAVKVRTLRSGWRREDAAREKGYEQGKRRGWNEAIEAAAEWLGSQEGYGSRNRLEYAHGIRKLKKP